jgi:hypothetical protein
LKRVFSLLLLIVICATPCAAEVRLRLSSGQVLEGTDVYREGGNYYLTMADGGVIPIPHELVASVELTGKKEEPKPEPEVQSFPGTGLPSGLTPGKPQQLAGDPVTPLSRREQTEALGEPSEFQQGVFDPNWHPESDWKGDQSDPHRNDFAPSTFQDGIIDPQWVPENAYPEDQIEFAPSEFEKSIIDPSWVPQDGFKKKTSLRTSSARRFMVGQTIELTRSRPEVLQDADLAFSSSYESGRALTRRCKTCPGGAGTIRAAWIRSRTVSASVRQNGPIDPASCVGELLEAYLDLRDEAPGGSNSGPTRTVMESLDHDPMDGLPIDLHRVRWEFEDRTLRLIYTARASGCRPINGDLSLLLGIELSDEQHLALATSAYNAIVADNPVSLGSDEVKVDYAYAVAALVDPQIPGEGEVPTILLRDAADLSRVRQAIAADDSVPRKERRRRAKALARHVDPPRVSGRPGAELVTFEVWTGADGNVRRFEVRLFDRGRVGVRRDPA